MKTLKITPDIKRIVGQAIKVALTYEKLTGRKLGITGEIGEVLVCAHPKLKKYGLKLIANPLSAGADAIGRHGKLVQIKAKRPGDWRRRYLGRISKFADHNFNYAILALINSKYEIKELYLASHKKLAPILGRYPRRNPPIARFINKKISKRLL